MSEFATDLLPPDAAGVARAVAIWRVGGLVAFPTETVYGLGGDATNGLAVARIFEAKGRPSFNPLIIHVADQETAERFARFGPEARRLAAAFWPGPLSLVLPVRAGSGLSPLVTAGLDTVAVRIPQHKLARDLLSAFGGAIAAPSANPSGRISPTRAAHVMAGLGGRIEAVMDGGPADVGLESTIVLPDAGPVALLRAGGLPVEALEQALGHSLAVGGSAERPSSPGQLLSHYAPKVPVRLNVRTPADNALWLGFGPECDGADLNLAPGGDLREAAANLFAMLHMLDARAALESQHAIAVAPIPHQGLGIAINDRLNRASRQ
jgi:L-threonylcarbamoyladenylate synthase